MMNETCKYLGSDSTTLALIRVVVVFEWFCCCCFVFVFCWESGVGRDWPQNILRKGSPRKLGRVHNMTKNVHSKRGTKHYLRFVCFVLLCGKNLEVSTRQRNIPCMGAVAPRSAPHAATFFMASLSLLKKLSLT